MRRMPTLLQRSDRRQHRRIGTVQPPLIPVIFLGLAKGGLSGVATGATPLLALYLPPLEAAALLMPIVLCQDAISVHAYWREWSSWNLKILLPGAVFGLVLGYLFAANVSDDLEREAAVLSSRQEF